MRKQETENDSEPVLRHGYHTEYSIYKQLDISMRFDLLQRKCPGKNCGGFAEISVNSCNLSEQSHFYRSSFSGKRNEKSCEVTKEDSRAAKTQLMRARV